MLSRLMKELANWNLTTVGKKSDLELHMTEWLLQEDMDSETCIFDEGEFSSRMKARCISHFVVCINDKRIKDRIVKQWVIIHS